MEDPNQALNNMRKIIQGYVMSSRCQVSNKTIGDFGTRGSYCTSKRMAEIP